MRNLVFFGIVIASLAFAFVSVDTSPAEERNKELRYKERTAIDACREKQDDELLELSMRRTIRDMCDAMQDEYDRKWRS